ncbi:MAG: hypothetical protein MI749_22280 [Desulfovibrionales bacterium]|nr:hypothetical protein [Desulfovibrionales bacterium]
MSRTPELVDMAFIGDRLVDTARSLGVHPRLMATAMIPMIEEQFPLTRQIECTACVMGHKQSAFLGLAKRLGIRRIILEKSGDPSLDPSTIAQVLEEKDFEVGVADFSQGTLEGIKSTARGLDSAAKGEKLAGKYEEELGRAWDILPANLNKRILVLLGLNLPGNPDDLLLVEEPGMTVDGTILSPCGCTNVGSAIKKAGGPTDDQPMRLIETLDGLEGAAPDMIALTGNPSPGLLAIHEYILRHPKAGEIPAIANQAIFSLPHCCEAEPMALPRTLLRWSRALESV